MGKLLLLLTGLAVGVAIAVVLSAQEEPASERPGA
jgi:hypothetical protein